MDVKVLLETVNAGIKDGDVAGRVVEHLVEKELTARKEAFLVVLAKLDETRKAEKKITPDSVLYPVVDGKPSKDAVPSYTKSKLEELKKNTDEQEKLTKALETALQGDFSKVKELAAKAG